MNERIKTAIEKVEHKILDKGFIRVIDIMGDDAAIAEAARVSYGKGTKTKRQDAGLIRYLLRNWHTSPFEMCEIKFHIKCPIFVMRQWIRHRTANVNEYSARYSEVKDDFYIPDLERIQGQSTTNKQGSDGELPLEIRQQFRQQLIEQCQSQYNIYKQALENGVARQTARIILPLNTYTEFYWKIDLHNLLHFIRLRADHHAQWEIRQYANAMLEIVKNWVPAVYEAFIEYRMESQNISKTGLENIRKMIKGESIEFEESNFTSKREFNEFIEKVRVL